MQLSDIRTSVRTRLGRPANDAKFTDAVLTDIVNEALQELAASAEWPWLQNSAVITTTSTTDTYTVPANWVKTKYLQITGYSPIDYQPIEQIVGFTGPGQPTRYTVSKDHIVLRPIPDTTYSINHIYYEVEPILVNDSDTPLLPPQFHYGIVEKALAIAYQRVNQLDAYQVANNAAMEWLGKIEHYNRRIIGPIVPKTARTFWV